MTLTRIQLREKALSNNVPEHLIDGLVAYVLDHRPTGGFLRYVLENNLVGAVLKADRKSYDHLINIVYFIRSYFPHDSWGSEDAVNEWLAQRSVESADGEGENRSGSVQAPANGQGVSD